VPGERPRDPQTAAPPGGPGATRGGRDARGEEERFFELAAFWRSQALWPVTFCGLIGLSALGAGAVSMALTRANPFARAALAVAALTTAFGLWDFRSRKGKLGGGAVLVALLWALSIAGGLLLARTGG
jgi:hypothetical protein